MKAEDMWGKISAAIYLLVVTDIALVVQTSTLCTDGALIYDDVYIKGLVYIPNKYRIDVPFSHLGWVVLNT